MQDLRRIAERRAARPKNKPVGSSFESEHQRAKKAVVKQIEELSGSGIHLIAANTEDENGKKKALRVPNPLRRFSVLKYHSVSIRSVLSRLETFRSVLISS